MSLESPSSHLHICMLTRSVMHHQAGGGMELQTEVLRQGLVERGHRVTMITTPHPNGHAHVKDSWGETLFAGAGAPAVYTHDWWQASLATLLQAHAHDPIDVVAGHGKAAYTYLGMRRHLPAAQQIPTVVITHNTIISEMHAQFAQLHRRPQSVARWLLRATAFFLDDRRRLPLADAITTTTEENAQDIRRWFSPKSSQVTVIPNGVDIAMFMAGEAFRDSFRQQLGAAGNEVRIIVVLARLVRDKGQHYLLDALALPAMQPFRDTVRVVLAGDGPARKSLASQVEALGLQDSVLFLGRVPHDEVAGLLAAADIVALPTISEGMSLSLLEAMASGRPVVASDIPAIASFVEDGVTGRIVPVAQPAALARALVALLDNSADAAKLGARGRAYVAARYDQRTMVAGYERVFLHAAGATGAESTPVKNPLSST